VSRFTSCTRAPAAPLHASSAAGARAATAAPPSRARARAAHRHELDEVADVTVVERVGEAAHRDSRVHVPVLACGVQIGGDDAEW